MSNTIEIVVEGKNEATKVFQDVEKDATSSARKTEQSWDQATDKVADGLKKTSDSAKEADESLGKLGETAKKSGKSTEDLGKGGKETADRLKNIGEASDEVDTKAMGFRDTVTGVSDTLKGFSDTSLTTEQRLLTLGAGIGDLGSAGYNFLVPMFGKAKDALADFGKGIVATVTDGKALGSMLVKVGASAAVIGGAVVALHALADPVVPPNVQKLTDSLQRFYATGHIAGEAANVFGGNMQDFKDSLTIATSRGVDGFLEGLTDIAGNIVGVDSRLDDANGRLKALDASLTSIAGTSPQKASQIFGELTTKAGFTKDQIEALKNHLPGFTAAMDAAGISTGRTAQDTKTLSDSLSEYLTNLQSATDPVFNLVHSLEGVTTAQKGYTDAVKQHGKNSGEAKDAAFGLAESLSKMESAALNGDLSYQAFDATLNHWVSSGALTAQQAQNIRSRVDEAKGAADRYQGNYNANLYAADYASPAIEALRRNLAALHDRDLKITVTTYYGTSGRGQSLTGIPVARAVGGPIGHAAEGGPRSNTTLVGEYGPELVKLPVGSFVNPAGASSRSPAAAGVSGPIQVQLTVQSGSSPFDQLFAEMIRKYVQVNGGGNVQQAFGRS
ncbi:hypothetical protein VA596_41720 [Amycolatopsis sp., V23-08]|uniref:Uncharacterized protein n=1 Tax=Amycolatopsis heterodermiae TaxID=3110235 RepID=A0ABU5RII0_9PSEU|nr:hypothetical protein [Amycolatopsis sp., V23-08]MEA5366106.1 hypothetical protein [Amycolatopsis sp., V23-08]